MLRFILLLVVLTSTSHAGISWKLEVKYPDHELKTYDPPKGEIFKINMGKSMWSCALSLPQEDKKESNVVHTREVLCVRGKDPSTVVGTRAVCVSNKDFQPSDSTNLHLFDNRRQTIIIISCNGF